MFNVTFYQNNSEPNKVDKELREIVTLSGVLKDETSIVNPTILIESNTIIGNYVYIPTFNRYYYITDIVSFRNKLWQVSLKCDVLMSFRNDIRKNNALVARQQYEYNMYLKDPLMEVYSDTFTITKKLSKTSASTFKDAGFLLIAQ